MSDKPFLSVELRDQKGLVMQGPAKSVSSKNSKGPFDVLPQHAHFITLIQDEIVVTHQSGKTQRYEVTRGVMRCFNNKVEIFTGLDSTVAKAA